MKIIHKSAQKIQDAEDTTPPEVKLPPWKVLIVDDEPDVHAITRLNLKNFQFANKSLRFLEALSAREAKQILSHEIDIAVALIDVVMETDDAGLRLVDYIRNELGNSMIRIVVRTGQPGAAPERQVVDSYDIDDYKDKTELTVQKLYTTLRSTLKSYRDLTTINANRRGLEKILDAAAELYQPQSIHGFFDGVLTQIIALCNLGENNLISTVSSGLLITASEERIAVQAGTGRFAQLTENPQLKEIIQACTDSVLHGQPSDKLLPSMVHIPLRVHDHTMGFVCLENALHLSHADQHLIQIMANQCASALRNLQLYVDLKEANRQALYMLAVAAEYKDKDTGDHINRLARYTALLSEAMGMSKQEAENYGLASMLHDIGKVGIADAILKKPGKLTDEEFAIMKTHAEIGAEILGKSKWFAVAYHIAYCHHERWDGTGYPRGLKGEEIPIAARIVSVVDVFDALTNKRCYKEPWTVADALVEIEKGAGTHFDPKVVHLLLQLCEQGIIP
jgi:response regulator RpfG family c-di-GMP phosphodiesterase